MPPQSTSVSVPSWMPSPQVAAMHTMKPLPPSAAARSTTSALQAIWLAGTLRSTHWYWARQSLLLLHGAMQKLFSKRGQRPLSAGPQAGSRLPSKATQMELGHWSGSQLKMVQ